MPIRSLMITTLGAAALLAGCAASQQSITIDRLEGPTTLVKNGYVIDGTGATAQIGHLLIDGDRIADIAYGDLPTDWARATTVIDADGKAITPGFIDTHAHGNPLQTPEFHNFLAMGVTTIALGQDGSSTRVGNLAEWMRSVDAVRPGPNVITYVGHGTIRRESGVGLSENPTDMEIAAMESLVDEGLSLGAYGLTTGLEYQPGTFSSMEELVAVARPVAARDAVVMSHMRSEDDDVLLDSIEELLEQGQRSGARVHVSHIKSVYGQGESRAEEILARLEQARAEGHQITADIYPYTASFTGLALLFPDYALPPHDYEETVETRREELGQYLFERVARRNGPEATLFGTGPDAGKTLAQVAAERGVSYEEVLIDKGPRGGSAAYFVMDEDLQARLLLDPMTNVCSDGSPTMRHPRGYGSFAKVIAEYVVEHDLLTLEEAVYKMSGLAAETTGLVRDNRGKLAPGFAADILIFDPRDVRDTATFENPHQLATGFDTVLVNGVVVRRNDEFTGARSGRMLRAPWAE